MAEERLKESWLRHKETGSFVPLLVLLEHPHPDAAQLISSLESNSFPYSGLIAFAFSGEVGDYWADLAIGWLEQGARVDEKIAQSIYAMVERKWASQRTRHRALRLVKRWERSRAA